MREKIQAALKAAAKELFNAGIDVNLTRPDEQFGDYATNAALQLANTLNRNPKEIAEQLAVKLAAEPGVTNVDIAGPGFINLRLSDAALWKQANSDVPKTLSGKSLVVEYSDPNPFKVLHAGHLYTSVVGDAIANILETAGGQVHRVNYGGDVGLHVGKTMWAILQRLGGEHPEKLIAIPAEEQPDWLAAAYVEGTTAYEDNEAAKAEIIALNKRVYAFHTDNDHNSPLALIYWTCREWSYDYFKAFYQRIGTEFERVYPESEVAALGLQTVREQLAKGVFAESDGAVIFKGEDYGLHTRVFINSEGLPTYEAKDIGLIMTK